MENFTYRFSGYSLPKIQLDSTGETYIYISFKNIPADNYSQPFYFVNSNYSARESDNLEKTCNKLYLMSSTKKYK